MANRPFDWSSLFFAALSFLDVIQQCRLGYRPIDRRHLCLNDRRHLCSVMACVIKLDKVCKEIAEWEGWDAKEYKKMLTDYPERYKERTNRAFVCFGKSRKQIQPDLGNWWYAFLYYYLHLQRPEFVKQLSRLKESLQVNRGPVTGTDLNNKGDVIEYGLYRVRFTGPAIPQGVRDRNIEMMQKFCQFGDLMHDLEMHLARSPILPQSSADRWCNSERAHPDALAQAIYDCAKLHADQNDANLRNAHSAVQRLCTPTPMHVRASMDSALRQHLGWQKYRWGNNTWWHKQEDGQCRFGLCLFEAMEDLRTGFVQ